MMSAQLQQQAAGSASSGSPGEASGLGAAGSTPVDQPAAPAVPSEPLRTRAGESNSPYVRAQSRTLVHWQLFDQAAIDLARKENKLVFLHIGFLACHYCHMTSQDSFSNPTVASILNESFIPIIVDREERPDIDAIYWNYLQLVNNSAGWPINVFLTPDLEPVFGGSYWPGPGSESSVRDDLDNDEEPIGFLGVLEKLRQSWMDREGQCRTEAKESVAQLEKFAAEGTLGPRGLLKPGETSGAPYLSSELDIDIDQLDEACLQLKKTFDPVNGGFGVVPKFVTPAKYSFLLQVGSFPSVVQDIVGETEAASTVQMALFTLRKLRDSALHDHLSGGFARASHTINWTLPHFEKLVPDNGLLLNLYLDAWLYSLRTANKQDSTANTPMPTSTSTDTGTAAEFADVVYALADYLSSTPIRLENGAFASSEAADSYYRKGDRHMREGAYYVWTRRELDTVLGGENGEHFLEARTAAAYWNVLQHGNIDREDDPYDEFINQNVLYVTKDATELARQFRIPREEVVRVTSAARKKLAAYRDKERLRPPLDDKVVVSSNGIVIGALARTGAALKYGGFDPANGDKYIDVARKAATFIKKSLWESADKELYRVYSNGKREPVHGFAEDYAFLIEGLLELYEGTGELEWLQWADDLQKRQIELFYDRPDEPSTRTHSSSGGFYRTRDHESSNILRLKDGMDTTLPATNGVAASNLFRLGSLLGDAAYAHLARETIHAFEVEMAQHAWLFPSLLAQLVTAHLGGRQLVSLAASPSASDPVVSEYFRRPRAGLRTLAFVAPQDATATAEDGLSSWLQTRNPGLVAFGKEERDIKDGGTYVFNSGVWQKATANDLTLNAEASQ
ncbi:DUF255 domain containing protein [Niveomyces insectorum RCEF 264]|uniref:DUF255 domain containing protein n=1 Tax=Niveomyces insectorum RCEF 264 TaxID=1081102 RepID=A0A167T5E1_9HYPO|nr:DUF255 domain containing protein [Niveomyces insectorum RCEF 264]